MHRTNLYLSSEQERRLDERAGAAGISRSALVRAIIDRELATTSFDPGLEAELGQLADLYGAATAGMFDDDPDLRIDR